MKTLHLLLYVLFCLPPAVSGAGQAVTPPPSPTKYFNDFAGSVDPGYAAEKNQRLERFERESSNQFIVAVFRQLPPGISPEDYCLRTFNAWGVGQKGINNGVVLFVFVDSHKLRLEVGRGLETSLTNAKAQEITDRITQRFKQGDFLAGYDVGINGVIDALQARPTLEAAPAASP